MTEILNIIVAVLTGLAAALPLAVKLVQYVRAAARERNWSGLLKLVLDLMEDAEELFTSGADKKAWVMEGVQSLADTVNYDISEQALSDLIDALCGMSKLVNAPEDGEVWYE